MLSACKNQLPKLIKETADNWHLIRNTAVMLNICSKWYLYPAKELIFVLGPHMIKVWLFGKTNLNNSIKYDMKQQNKTGGKSHTW